MDENLQMSEVFKGRLKFANHATSRQKSMRRSSPTHISNTRNPPLCPEMPKSVENRAESFFMSLNNAVWAKERQREEIFEFFFITVKLLRQNPKKKLTTEGTELIAEFSGNVALKSFLEQRWRWPDGAFPENVSPWFRRTFLS